MTLPVQLATIREFCPVCSGTTTPGFVAAATPGIDGLLLSLPCPHCTDATALLEWLKERDESAA